MLTQPDEEAEQRSHFAFDLDEEPVYSDYLTQAVLLSAIAATAPRTARTASRGGASA